MIPGACVLYRRLIPAHGRVEGSTAFELQSLRTPKRWAFGTRAGRRLHSVSSGYNSPQHPDSLFSFEAEQSFLKGFFFHVKFNSWQAFYKTARLSSLLSSKCLAWLNQAIKKVRWG